MPIVALCVMALVIPAPRPDSTRQAEPPQLEQLVFVTEDNPFYDPGCDAISVFSLSRGEAVHRGTTQVSPGRLAAPADFSFAVALNSNVGLPGPLEPFLYVLRGDPVDRSSWSTEVVVGDRFAVLAGLAVMPKGDELLVPVVGSGGFGPQTPLVPPYHLNKYRTNEIDSGRIGPVRGRFELDGPPFSVIPTSDGEAHVVTEQGTVYTIHVGSMTESRRPIALKPIVTDPSTPWNRLSKGHADVTSDGRYLVSNRWEASELNVADLETRDAWTIPVTGAAWTGGVAVNKGWLNPGLLALHTGPAAVLYSFKPESRDAALTELGRLEFGPPLLTFDCPYPMCMTAAASVAWSASGHHVIVAAQLGLSEFLAIGVQEGGRALTRGHWFTACPRSYPVMCMPNDILTANGYVTPPPTPSPTANTRPSITPSPTPTRSAPPTSSPTPLPFETPTKTPTTVPASIYLPLALSEICDPTLVRADVVLVIDTSSSMSGQKLADAKEAAITFVRLMDLAPARDQVAVVRFDADAEMVAELSGDRSVMEKAIWGLETRQGTHIDAGLRKSLEELQSPRRIGGNTPVVVLLTDGMHRGAPGAELIAAQQARDAGFRLYTVGLGADVDEPTLVEVAGSRTRYYFAPDSTYLRRIYAEVAHEIDCPAEDFWGKR